MNTFRQEYEQDLAKRQRRHLKTVCTDDWQHLAYMTSVPRARGPALGYMEPVFI